MSLMPPKRGGVREGAGPPALSGAGPAISKSIRLLPEHVVWAEQQPETMSELVRLALDRLMQDREAGKV